MIPTLKSTELTLIYSLENEITDDSVSHEVVPIEVW